VERSGVGGAGEKGAEWRGRSDGKSGRSEVGFEWERREGSRWG